MRRVLVADDDSGIVHVINALLTHDGYRVNGCGNGAQALAWYRSALYAGRQSERYFAVISDYRMPNMDGLTLFSEIRKLDQATILFLMSGYITKQMVGVAGVIGVDEILLKPDDMGISISHKLAKYWGGREPI